MLKQGVVRLSVMLDPQVFGCVTTAVVFLEVDPVEEEKIMKALMEIPEVTYVAYGQCTNETSIEARFKDNEVLREFSHHTFPRMRGVKVTRDALVSRILRNIDEWMPPKEDFALEGG